MPRPQGPERVCEAWVWLFAGWTLCANACVALGGSLRQLVLLAASAALTGAGLRLWRKAAARLSRSEAKPSEVHDSRLSRSEAKPSEVHDSRLSRSEAKPSEVEDSRLPRSEPQPSEARKTAAALAVAIALVALLAATGDLRSFWLGAVALLAALLLGELRSRPVPPPLPAPLRHDWVLVALCLLSALLNLVAQRPDADDAWLLNLAAAAADLPDAPLLSRDSLHGLPGAPSGVPAGLPTYRLHAIELLAAALAWLTPLRAIDAAHLLLAPLAAALVPLAQARLLRLLIPQRWVWGVVFAWLFLVGVGDTHLAYGNFALVRMHQGKALLASVALPLVASYALEFARDPRSGRWLRLAAAEVAALGASASALWMAPAVAGLGLACGLPLTVRGLRIGAVGLAASAYPLAAGLAVAEGARAALAEYGLRHATADLAGHALGAVLGNGPAASAALLAALAAGCLARGGLERRFALIFPLGFLLVFWNPWTAAWLAEQLTGVPTYWRVFWVLPLPALVGMALSAPLRLPSRRLGAALALLLAGVALFWAPSRSTLSPANRVRLGAPGLKVPPAAFTAARTLARHAGSDAQVLAPYPVASWLSTLHHHPLPLAVRRDYLLSLRQRLGEAEVVRRGRLVALVGGGGDPDDASLLAAAAASGELAAVCLAAEAPGAARRALEQADFERVEVVEGFEIWAPRRGLSRGRRP